MLDYQFLFNILIAFIIGVVFGEWLNYQKSLKECDKCHGKGYVRK
jgi:uncharacterized membrane protein YqgA involved in biofilm formation